MALHATFPDLGIEQRRVAPSPLEETVEFLRSLPDVSGAAVVLRREGEMRCAASVGDAPAEGTPVHPGAGLSGEAIRSGKRIYCRDSADDNRVNAAARRTLKSILIVPIVVDGVVEGLVQLYSGRIERFSPKDIVAVEECAAKLRTELEKKKPQSSEAKKPIESRAVPAGEDTAKQKEQSEAPLFASASATNISPFSRTLALVIGLFALAVMIAIFFWARHAHSVKASEMVTPPPPAAPAAKEWKTVFANEVNDEPVRPAPARTETVVANAAETRKGKPQKQEEVAELPVELQSTSKGGLKVVPVFADSAADIPGTVQLAALINPDGSVQDASAVQGPADLRTPAEQAVKQWRYKPQSAQRKLTVRVRLLP